MYVRDMTPFDIYDMQRVIGLMHTCSYDLSICEPRHIHVCDVALMTHDPHDP